MISIGSGLVWNGLLKAFGGLPGLILSAFFDFPNYYFFNRPPRGFFLPSLALLPSHVPGIFDVKFKQTFPKISRNSLFSLFFGPGGLSEGLNWMKSMLQTHF